MKPQTTTLTRETYQRLIDEDVEWLEANAPKSIERDHIVQTLRYSVSAGYDGCHKCGTRRMEAFHGI